MLTFDAWEGMERRDPIENTIGKPKTHGCRILIPRAGQSSSNVLVMDATLSEVASDGVTCTDVPIESGASISDHAYRKPVRLSLTVFATDTPVTTLRALENVGTPNAPRMNTSELQSNPRRGRAHDFYEELREAAETFRLVRVITGMRVYRDMLIVNVGVSRTSNNSARGALRIRLRLKQVSRVNFAVTHVGANVFASEISAIEEAESSRRRARTPEPVPEETPAETAAGQQPERRTSELAKIQDRLADPTTGEGSISGFMDFVNPERFVQ